MTIMPIDPTAVQPILGRRLHALRIAGSHQETPAQLVSRLGAMQAQDYPGTLWSVALRLPGTTRVEVERAIAAREIVRTWPMRGTLHLMAAADVRWMSELLTPRVIRGAAGRWRQLELDEATFAQSREILTKALAGDRQLPRSSLYAILDQAGVSPAGQRGFHILGRLSQEGLLCLGPHMGKEPSFALLDDWIPGSPRRSREDSLGELARRYFTSHGPASLKDFTWWSGLTVADAKNAILLAGDALRSEDFGTQYWSGSEAQPEEPTGTYLLPGFDEYLLGYTDRSPCLNPVDSQKVIPGNNGMFMPTIIQEGKVVGTWRRTIRKTRVTVTLQPFVPVPGLAETARESLAAYGAFLGLPAELA